MAIPKTQNLPRTINPFSQSTSSLILVGHKGRLILPKSTSCSQLYQNLRVRFAEKTLKSLVKKHEHTSSERKKEVLERKIRQTSEKVSRLLERAMPSGNESRQTISDLQQQGWNTPYILPASSHQSVSKALQAQSKDMTLQVRKVLSHLQELDKQHLEERDHVKLQTKVLGVWREGVDNLHPGTQDTTPSPSACAEFFRRLCCSGSQEDDIQLEFFNTSMDSNTPEPPQEPIYAVIDKDKQAADRMKRQQQPVEEPKGKFDDYWLEGTPPPLPQRPATLDEDIEPTPTPPPRTESRLPQSVRQHALLPPDHKSSSKVRANLGPRQQPLPPLPRLQAPLQRPGLPKEWKQ